MSLLSIQQAPPVQTQQYGSVQHVSSTTKAVRSRHLPHPILGVGSIGYRAMGVKVRRERPEKQQIQIMQAFIQSAVEPKQEKPSMAVVGVRQSIDALQSIENKSGLMRSELGQSVKFSQSLIELFQNDPSLELGQSIDSQLEPRGLTQAMWKEMYDGVVRELTLQREINNRTDGAMDALEPLEEGIQNALYRKEQQLLDGFLTEYDRDVLEQSEITL